MKNLNSIFFDRSWKSMLCLVSRISLWFGSKKQRRRGSIRSHTNRLYLQGARKEGKLHCRDKHAAKSLQSCPTLCDLIDGSLPGSPVPGILQARTLEGVAISFSIAWKWKVKGKSLSRVRLFVTPWTAAYQAPPSMRFSRQEYWSGVPLPSLIANITIL